MEKEPTNLDICNLVTETFGVITQQLMKIMDRISKNSIESSFLSAVYFLLGVSMAFIIVFATTENELYLYVSVVAAIVAIILLLLTYYLGKKHDKEFKDIHDKLEKTLAKLNF